MYCTDVWTHSVWCESHVWILLLESGRVVDGVFVGLCMGEKHARRLEDVSASSRGFVSCMRAFTSPIARRGRRRVMGSTSIDGDGEDEEEGPSVMDGRGRGDEDDEARRHSGRHRHRGHHRGRSGTSDVEAGRSRRAVRAEAETDDLSVAERLCATQLGVSYDKRDRSWTEHGEACLLATGQLYPACATAMGMRTANISLCGYMELVPNVVGATYFVGVAGTVASCVWGTLRATRAEPNRALKAARFAVGMTPAVTLAGTFVFPRCMWNLHQTCVVWWAWSALFAMIFEWVVDSKFVARRARRGERVVTSDVVLPQLTYIIGFAITLKFYFTNSTDFFRGEILSANSFSWWCLSKHRAGTFAGSSQARTYTWRELFLVDGLYAALMMCVYRFNQYHGCGGVWGTF